MPKSEYESMTNWVTEEDDEFIEKGEIEQPIINA
jgi:hypothetical protein